MKIHRRIHALHGRLPLVAVICALLVAGQLWAQNNTGKAAPANPFSGNDAAIAEGQNVYNRACTGCHGKDGAVGDRAPALAVPARRYLRITDAELFTAIEKGITGTLMPPSGLSEPDAWKVTAFIRALRGTAIDVPAKGNVARGEQIFLGKGGCIGCHMLKGKGGLIGPDLSEIASQRKLMSIQDALTKPQHTVSTDGGHHDASLTPSSRYQPVRVVTIQGDTVSGVLRNEDNFSLQVLGSDNALHLFKRDQLREVIYEEKSLMPSDYDKKLTADEMKDLLAFLSRQGKVARAARDGQQDDN
jgi:putative heme-binding domain-containing protein